MDRLFGTDGIRGLANQHPITTEMGLKLGRAVVQFCERKGYRPKVIIGRDTRESGEMLENAVVSGVVSAGGDIFRTGVLPTPGVAYLTRDLGGGTGMVISASHNPHDYNGFKIFSHQGFKLSDNEEMEIEGLISSTGSLIPHSVTGKEQILVDAWEGYVTFLRTTFPENFKLEGMRIVLDCANGATFKAAPVLFERLGAEIETLSADPDGKNINRDCGSQHTEALRRKVLEVGADMGLAFDGDGDRLIAVDDAGKVLTGDQILTICAKMLKKKGELKSNVVISTVMSNMGFPLALNDFGIDHAYTKVGDRYVTEEMRARNANLGGEESGHIIFLDHQTTGDGLLSALYLSSAILWFEQPLSELSVLMKVFPQTVFNIPVKAKPEISTVPELVKVIEVIDGKLGKRGRVLVRYSGTEPVCRIMVEGERQEEIDGYARQIENVIREQLG